MKTRILSIAVLVLSLLPIQAVAIENGEDATASPFVVPVLADLGNGTSIGCSGTLIAPSIVVTAGHCVLDANGLVTKNVFVGMAGSSRGSITFEDKIKAVKITSTFQNAATGKVGDDDLAFLILEAPQEVEVPIVLASEKQIADFKSRGVSLKAIGYGRYTNAGSEITTFPKSLNGVFSPYNSDYLNSAYMKSTPGRVCRGDSGAPVLNISATQVTLVGVMTGTQSELDGNCGQKGTDGNYYSLFTLVGRYANLAFSSAAEVMNTDQQTIATLKTSVSDLESQLSEATESASETASKFEDTMAILAAYRKQMPKAIVCTSTKSKKLLVVLNSKCPTGYKKKQGNP